MSWPVEYLYGRVYPNPGVPEAVPVHMEVVPDAVHRPV